MPQTHHKGMIDDKYLIPDTSPVFRHTTSTHIYVNHCSVGQFSQFERLTKREGARACTDTRPADDVLDKSNSLRVALREMPSVLAGSARVCRM